MQRKVVFMDIDGTLMHEGKVSSGVIDAICAARAKGHMFFLCTGRSLANLPEPLRNVGWLDGFVLGCGVHCAVNGEIVYQKRLPREVLLAAAEYYLQNGRECLIEGENRLLAINSDRPQYQNFEDVERLDVALETTPVSKITIIGKLVPEDEVFLSQWFDVYDMGGWVDAVPTGETKATGMQHVLDKLELRREDCIAVGDGMNDLPMLGFAGLGVAMGNAPDAVKAAADAVTTSCVNDGVAAMIEKYLA